MMRRRDFTTWAAIGSVGTLFGTGPGTAQAHANPGPVSPSVLASDLPLTDHLGRPQTLRRWLTGQVTVVQTIFTGCSSICPIQGALFVAAQKRLAGQAPRLPVRWLSISIDPLGDTPESLRAWLLRMGPAPDAWAAGLPRLADVERLRRELDGVGAAPTQSLDEHSDKVYFFDAQAQLRWRTGSLPTVDEVVRVARQLAAQAIVEARIT